MTPRRTVTSSGSGKCVYTMMERRDALYHSGIVLYYGACIGRRKVGACINIEEGWRRIRDHSDYLYRLLKGIYLWYTLNLRDRTRASSSAS